jgi:hypothetical protein
LERFGVEKMTDEEKEIDYIFHQPLIKCEGCQVEAIRDVWIKWGLVCVECGAKKVNI